MTIVDKRTPKPLKPPSRPRSRVALTDGTAPQPATMAVDVAPRAGDPAPYAVPIGSPRSLPGTRPR